MFYALDSFRLYTPAGHITVRPGDTVLYDGHPMRLVRLEQAPGGESAELAGLPGVEYPHPVYSAGFTCAAENMRPA